MIKVNPKIVTNLEQIAGLRSEERETLREVTKKFPFKSNEYYLSLIDWNNPSDPIRRLVIPHKDELIDIGELDASNEADYTKAIGLQHKYEDTAILLVSNTCASLCRYCFRKRIFRHDNQEVTGDISGEALGYLRNHKEINNVLISGGDPLMLPTDKLENIISKIRDIEHVEVIRIGSKVPAFNPYRILEDPKLPQMLGRYVRGDQGEKNERKGIYLMTHFDHPRELTDVAVDALYALQTVGVTTLNQTPLIKGINDDPEVLAELFRKTPKNGVTPYYIFICRPTKGNYGYSVPIEEAFDIFNEARTSCSGTAQTAKLVMSHSTGKIQILGKTEDYVLMRYHRAAKEEDKGRIMIFESNPYARWFDDYTEPIKLSHTLNFEGAFS